MISKRVLDLNAGLGGRVYALKMAGFEIVGAIDNDVENCEIMASWLGNSKVIQANLLELESDSLPEADLIIGKYIQQSFSSIGKGYSAVDVNISIYNIISKKNPFAFLLEVPVSSIVNKRYELDSRKLTDVKKENELIAGRNGREMSGVTTGYCKMGERGFPQLKVLHHNPRLQYA